MRRQSFFASLSTVSKLKQLSSCDKLLCFASSLDLAQIPKVFTDKKLVWKHGMRVEALIVATESRVAQRKRAGPITQRSMDRNHPLLIVNVFNEEGSKQSPSYPSMPTLPRFQRNVPQVLQQICPAPLLL